jgi:spermidine synthase/MFS family permease
VSAPQEPGAARGPGPALVVGLGSAAVLIAEIAAPRLLAPTVGTSLHAWAASIATFLGGLAWGNAWGGRLADRRGLAPLPLLGLLAGATLLLAIVVHAALHPIVVDLALSPAVAAVLVTPACFLLPAVLLGTLAPLATREALGGGGAPGRTLGWLGAAGSVGAAAGVLLAGYVLLPNLSTSAVLAIAAGLGAAPAVLLGLARRRAHVVAPPPPAAPDVVEASPDDAPTTQAPSLSAGRLRALSAFSGATFLALEMAAGRIAVLGLGNSLYTWTAVLAVMLAGSAWGAWLGGRYADRHPPRRALAQILVWCVLGVGVCLWTPLVMARVLTPGLPWALQCLLAATVGFLPAALTLGALGPALTRAALGARASHGRAVGGMQAAGTWGAVLGALAPPFVLLPLAGTAALVALLAFWLAWVADGVARSRQLLPLRGVLTLLIVLAIAPAGGGNVTDTLAGFGRLLRLREDAPGVVVRESAYYRIRVDPERTRWCLILGGLDAEALERDARLAGKVAWSSTRKRLYWIGAPMTSADYGALIEHVDDGRDQAAVAALAKRTHHTVRQLALDKLTHGFADLSDPRWVGYDYELVAASVWQRVAPAVGQHAFFVGGGPYTFQRRLLALDKDASLVTSEIDPEVTRTAFEDLGLSRDERHRVIHQDARLALPGFDRGSGPRYHVVFGDAFNDFSVPFHLTTQEFARDVKARLLPGGAYLVNVVDSFRHGAFLSAMRRTLASVFTHVEVLSLAPREDDERETFLLVASDEIVDLENLTDDFGRVLPMTRYPAAELDALAARTNAPLLTDAYAPVEALLAPLAVDAGR